MSAKTVQVHLNRLCNLSCAHCYSRSGPSEHETLDPQIVYDFLRDARSLGYDVVAFSGGEPFLYPRFNDVLACASKLGFAAIAVTNGTLLTGDRGECLKRLNLVGVSVDGPEHIHNAIRRSPTAFSRMAAGLDRLRAIGVPFGIAHT